jgi:NADPH-dependent 2,4-dienoyl-CoA reductase/sulfur reductase-like enzyme
VAGPEEILVEEELDEGAYLVVGGGLVGLEVADYLVQRGRAAVLIEMTAEFGQGLAPMRARLIQERLIRAGANLIPSARLTAVEGDWARVDLAGRPARLGPFRRVVLCVGYRGRSGPAETAGTKAILVGDALAARSLFEATQEGCQAALDLG